MVDLARSERASAREQRGCEKEKAEVFLAEVRIILAVKVDYPHYDLDRLGRFSWGNIHHDFEKPSTPEESWERGMPSLQGQRAYIDARDSTSSWSDRGHFIESAWLYLV